MSAGILYSSNAAYALKEVELKLMEAQRKQKKYATAATNLGKGFWSTSMISSLPVEMIGFVMQFQEMNHQRSCYETNYLISAGYDSRAKMGYVNEPTTKDMTLNWQNTYKERMRENAHELIAFFNNLEAETTEEIKLLSREKEILEGQVKFGDKLAKESSQRANSYLA